MIRFDDWLIPFLTDHEPEEHPFNPNEGDVDEIAESMLINGVYAPSYVSETSNYLVKGHHQYLALRALDAPRWPLVFRKGLSREEEIRMMLVDNKVGKMGRLDERREAEALRQLVDTRHGLLGTGYHDKELERMVNRLAREESPLSFGPGPGSGHILPREESCPVCGRPMGGKRG